MIYIRNLLGHTSVPTPEIYGKSGAKLKRQALENNSKGLVSTEEPQWENDADLKKGG